MYDREYERRHAVDMASDLRLPAAHRRWWAALAKVLEITIQREVDAQQKKAA